MAAAELVRYEASDGVATLTLDSPANRNALSFRLMDELAAALERARTEDAVRVVVLSHTGPVFCSGMDLKESRRPAGEQPVNRFPPILQAIWEFPKPVVARVGGPARAGGLGIVAACDIAVAATDATFAFTEVRIGVAPAVISVTVLPRLLPRAAHELLLTGEVFDGVRAAAIGLVTTAVDDVDTEVDRYVELLRLGAPGALAETKALLRREPAGSMAADFAAMLDLSARLFAGPEAAEGMAAFREKRRPTWRP